MTITSLELYLVKCTYRHFHTDLHYIFNAQTTLAITFQTLTRIDTKKQTIQRDVISIAFPHQYYMEDDLVGNQIFFILPKEECCSVHQGSHFGKRPRPQHTLLLFWSNSLFSYTRLQPSHVRILMDKHYDFSDARKHECCEVKK